MPSRSPAGTMSGDYYVNNRNTILSDLVPNKEINSFLWVSYCTISGTKCCAKFCIQSGTISGDTQLDIGISNGVSHGISSGISHIPLDIPMGCPMGYVQLYSG